MDYGLCDRDGVKWVLPVGVDEQIRARRTARSELCGRYLETAEAMALAVFDSVRPCIGQSDDETGLTGFQRVRVKGFNKTYAGKARPKGLDSVKTNTVDSLRGWSVDCAPRHRASRTRKGQSAMSVFPDRIRASKWLLKSKDLQFRKEGYAQVLELLRAMGVRGAAAGSTSNQHAVMREIYTQAPERYRLPRYGVDPEFIRQIVLDDHVIWGAAVTTLRERSPLLMDRIHGRYRVFLEVPRLAPMGVSQSPQSRTLRRLQGNVKGTQLNGLVLAIGSKAVLGCRMLESESAVHHARVEPQLRPCEHRGVEPDAARCTVGSHTARLSRQRSARKQGVTVMAVEKGSTGYKGCTFDRMINTRVARVSACAVPWRQAQVEWCFRAGDADLLHLGHLSHSCRDRQFDGL